MKHPGGPPSTAVTLKCVELLEDGQWHPFDAVVAEAGKLIPPGIARRRNEKTRRRNSGLAERKIELSDERRIASGRRSLVRDALRKPYWEQRQDDDGSRWVRLVQMPPRVLRDRALAEAGRALDVPALVQRAREGDDVTMTLRDLTHAELVRVALAMADALSAEASR